MQSDYQWDLHFANFRILQLLLESWFSTLTRRLGNFVTVYYNIVSLLRQSFSESQESELSSEKLVIFKILHFRNFSRNLVYFPWIKDLQKKLSMYRYWMESIWHQCFWKNVSINKLLKKVVFCEISHFTTFPKYFSNSLQDLKQLYRYLKFKCYQCNGKVSHNFLLIRRCSQSCF